MAGFAHFGDNMADIPKNADVLALVEQLDRALEIVRAVRERRARYLVTYRGRPVGLLMPLEAAAQAGEGVNGETQAAVWEELIHLGQEIGRGWQLPVTSAELLSEMRR